MFWCQMVWDKPLQNDLNNHLTSHTAILKTLHLFFFLIIGGNGSFFGRLTAGHIFWLVSKKDKPYLKHSWQLQYITTLFFIFIFIFMMSLKEILFRKWIKQQHQFLLLSPFNYFGLVQKYLSPWALTAW